MTYMFSNQCPKRVTKTTNLACLDMVWTHTHERLQMSETAIRGDANQARARLQGLGIKTNSGH